MKLEFENKLIPDYLFKELHLESYLENFTLNIPIIGTIILKHLSEIDLTERFQKLIKLKKEIDANKASFHEQINRFKQIPNLESILPFLKKGQVDQYHFYTLGKFITLTEKEETHPILGCVKKILDKYLTDNYAALKLSTCGSELRDQIYNYDKSIAANLNQFENIILNETGIKFIYPYPREFDEHESIQKLRDSKLITLSQNGNKVLATYNLPENILHVQSKRSTVLLEYEKECNKLLVELNTELVVHAQEFTNFYHEFKERVFLTAVAFCASKHNYAIPKLTAEIGLEIQNGKLPFLSQISSAHYAPLSISLEQGSSVLFGANMSGKTTVLKTLFFHLELLKVGLPVPAEKLQSHFPRNIEVSFKTSGNINKKLSSFGQEMDFFCQTFSNGDYLLVDELFHSTNPVSGTMLSTVILKEFKDKQLIFFCNTHYLDILKIEDIKLFKMRDIENFTLPENDSDLTLENLSEKIPYIPERIDQTQIGKAINESKKPLYMALHFPLPKSIANHIKELIKG